VPIYAALFLSVGYYQGLAPGTITRGTLGLLCLALVLGGLAAFALFYYVPAILGMQTGYPLAVLGSSTFGSRGGQLIPGPLAALMQASWYGAGIFYAADVIVRSAGFQTEGFSVPRAAVCVAAGTGLVWLGACGLRLAVWLSLLLAPLAAVALLAAVLLSKEGIAQHGLEYPESYPAAMLAIHVVAAFFAVAALAAPSLGLHASNRKDVVVAGLLGIWAPAAFAGTFALLAVAGIRGLVPGIEGYGFVEVVSGMGGFGGAVIPWLLLLGSIPALCSYSLMAQESVTVMAPGLSRRSAAGLTGVIGVLMAVSGAPADAQAFLTVSGALCAPVCGILAADYWSHDRRWPHTRPGVNFAGYGAWILGFVVGVLPLLPIPEHFQAVAHPAAVYSCLAGFAGYVVLGNIGLKPYRKHRRRRVRPDGEEEPAHPAGKPGRHSTGA
jgi:cytosine permease